MLRDARGSRVIKEADNVGIRFVAGHAHDVFKSPEMVSRAVSEVSPYGERVSQEGGGKLGKGGKDV